MNSRKTSTSVSLTIQKALTLWITTNWKILKEVGIANHLICLLRNLYAGQEATIRTLHRTADWFKIGKGVCHACTLSPCLFSLYAELFLFSRPVMSDCDPMCFNAWPSCPSPSPEDCPSPCPLFQWCHIVILSSASLFYFCLQSFPASGTFPKSQLFISTYQKYWSFSFSISPSSEFSGLISLKIDWSDLAVQGILKSLLLDSITDSIDMNLGELREIVRDKEA